MTNEKGSALIARLRQDETAKAAPVRSTADQDEDEDGVVVLQPDSQDKDGDEGQDDEPLVFGTVVRSRTTKSLRRAGT